MSENSNKIERIENEKLVELLGKIREDSSEENMIAVLKEAAVAKFLVIDQMMILTALALDDHKAFIRSLPASLFHELPFFPFF